MAKQKYTYDEIFQRNIGIFNKKQQEKLRNSTVSIAGLGGIGGLLFERLVRLGIENFKVAEPDIFEISNLNRQLFSNMNNIGKNKIDTVVDECKKINPNIKVKVFPNGISESNVDDFVQADIVVDAIEYNLPYFLYLLHKSARKYDKTVLAAQAIGFGASLYVFNKESIKFEDYIGLKNPENMTKKEINDYKIPVNKFCPRVPKYVSKKTIANVLLRKSHIPSCSLGVSAASSLCEMAIIAKILDFFPMPLAPKYICYDCYNAVKGPNERKANE